MLYVNQCIGYHLQFHVLSHDMYNAQDSDSEGESADDIEVTNVTTCESERHRSPTNLDVQDYQLCPHMVGSTVQLSIVHRYFCRK